MKPYHLYGFLACLGMSLIAHTVLEAAGYGMIVLAIIYTIGSISK